VLLGADGELEVVLVPEEPLVPFDEVLEFVDVPPLVCPVVNFVGPSPSKREGDAKSNPKLSLPSLFLTSVGPTSAPVSGRSSKLSLILIDGPE